MLDIFGTTFSFTTFRDTKFHTGLGNFLTFATVALIASFIGVFGVDLFNRSNPKVISEQIRPPEYPIISPNTKNFTFAWTIEDNFGYWNFTNILYPKIFYRNMVRNETSGSLETQNETVLENSPCNSETVQDQRFINSFNLHHWYCINFSGDNVKLGGFWDGKFLSYIYMYIYFCPDNNPNHPNCTSLKTLKKNLLEEQKLYFTIVYPEFYFEPSNLENPLRYSYVQWFDQMSINIIKRDRIFFKPVQADDDQNLLITEFKKFYQSAYEKFMNDVSFKNDKDYFDKTLNTDLYAFLIYFGRNGDKFTRKFMKLQDLAATVGGFMQLILVAGKILCQHYNSYNRNITLINEIFDFDESSPKLPKQDVEMHPTSTTQGLIMRKDSSNQILKLNDNNLNINEEKPKPKLNIDLIAEQLERDNSLKNIEEMTISNKTPSPEKKSLPSEQTKKMNPSLSQYTIHAQKDELLVGYSSMKERRSVADLNYMSQNRETLLRNRIKDEEIKAQSQVKEEFGLGMSLFIKKFLCRKLLTNKESDKVKLYEFALEYVRNKLDITSYMSYMDSIDKIKLFSYNELQNIAFKNLKKPNLYNKDELSLFELDVDDGKPDQKEEEVEDLEKKFLLVKYFIKKLKDSTFDELDKKLFDFLEPRLKKIILNEGALEK